MTEDQDPYGRGLRDFAARFEGVGFENVHAAVLSFIPQRAGAVLDVGAGSGRDAAWFAEAGWDVVGVEPSDQMRQFASSIHSHSNILWLDDRLPGLEATHRLGLTYNLLRPGGRIVLSLRHGAADLGRNLHDTHADEIERLASDHGLQVLLVREQPDALRRPAVHWTVMVLALP